MDGNEKSDSRVVPTKPPNNEDPHRVADTMGSAALGTKAETPETDQQSATASGSLGRRSSAEGVEGSRLPKGNSPRGTTHRTQGRARVSPYLERIRRTARKEKGLRFTALYHHVYPVESLREAYFRLKRRAAAGIDEVTWQTYGEDLEENLRNLSSRLRRGAYRASPVRRRYIAKADGSQRPLGITVLEDKLVQTALVKVLNAIYESDFLGFSYGSRPRRSAHLALDTLCLGIEKSRVNWVLDADIRGFYDALDHEWLRKFIEHRIGDRRVVRLIQKWLKAGVVDQGQWQASDIGSPQGASISSLLGNLYLHYVFDLWAHQWRQRHSRGDVRIVRYCDDIVICFEHRQEAEEFLLALQNRLGSFALELNATKTRLIEFGRRAATQHRSGAGSKPGTFNFLGFTHICGRSRKGWFRVERRSMAKRVNAKLKELGKEMMWRRHTPIPDQGKWLRSVIQGHYRHYAIPLNTKAIQRFRFHLVRLWHRALNRRSQKGRVPWERRMKRISEQWIPFARVQHPFPAQRLRWLT